jgi:hypothetical protein
MSEGEAPVHLVKGLAMHTIANHFPQQYGEETFERLLRGLPEPIQQALREPVIDEWYPESTIGEFFRAVYDQLAERDDDRFLEIVRLNMVAGISRFFRVFLNFASARFVLRKLPVVFHRVRQSPAVITPELTDEVVLLHYENFEFCGDRIYRMISLGNCQALAQVAIKQVPPSRVSTWGPDSMTMEFVLPTRKARAAGESLAGGGPSGLASDDPAGDSQAAEIVSVDD